MSGPRRLIPEPVKAPLRRLRGAWRSLKRGLRTPFLTCSVRGRKIRLLATTEIEEYRAETYESKEPDTLDWLDAEFGEDDKLFDIGANIGVYSLYAAKLSPRAKVYAFEPEAQNFAHLCRNVFANGLTNVVPCCAALSDAEAFAEFHVSELEAGTAHHALHGPAPERIGGPRSVFRQGTLSASLDALVGRFGLPAPSLMKIDVDGHEEAILAGAKVLLKDARLRSVLVEVNGRPGEGADSGIPALMRAGGFKLASEGPALPTGRGGSSRNCVFRRK